jgi:hypothetical protein
MPAVEWALGSLLGAGDVVWHGFSLGTGSFGGGPSRYAIEKLLEIMSSKTIPYTSVPYMFSYGLAGR